MEAVCVTQYPDLHHLFTIFIRAEFFSVQGKRVLTMVLLLLLSHDFYYADALELQNTQGEVNLTAIPKY